MLVGSVLCGFVLTCSCTGLPGDCNGTALAAGHRHCNQMCCICPLQGCTFLCVFGMSGAKLHHESTHALDSALQIFSTCSTSLRNLE